MFANKRQPAFISAQDLLLGRISNGRAQRKKEHDVYLPPPSTAPMKPLVGLVFFPGALVNHTAYASIAAALSDKGILVVVISLEPTRFVADIEINRQKAKEAIHDVVRANHVVVDEWVLAGHSAGAMTALNLAVENEEKVIDASISKAVVCGVGRNETGEKGATLRSNSTPFQVLVMNGTEDGILKFVTKQQHEDFVNLLPPSQDDGNNDGCVGRTKFVTIDGGNHAQFGDYGPSSMDGTASISSQEQQRIFVEATADFLLE
eukprot:CAMPEP_0172572422 /NCGR_PEP_ID=MMETSP1067-20121228/135052_1 /TAXON_ID=265564 ORGANISM="Thalassiosira punctigera, Strain Tpunct2005C2" /NCGR_SAMPLE_ID=MMETSP1067 /ASSEMBLY_ACC=CAM_ASM_000444 /LENGTH=261 /DNA_ID=CAMNT_0013364959 /DNA_START=246 /DNA_END=1034 /DNA_ORIENTATION=+